MVEYTDRESRQKFIAEKFGDYLKGSVLNIGGGGDKVLLNYCQPNEYIELDMCGEPDLLIDLDKEYPLPIENNRFDTIICTEVLEHLDEFHRVFEELLRISSSNIIISLPNALMTFRDYLKGTKYKGNAGEGGVEVGYYTKFYGLPLNKPTDRHRWFFSYTEASKFFNNNANKFGYKILDEFSANKTSSIKRRILVVFIWLFFGKHAIKDWVYGNYWCLLEMKTINNSIK